MRTSRRIWLLLVVTLLTIPSSLLAQCGVERWSVKTGTDADVSKVNLNAPTNTTITAMRAFTAPNPIPPNNRITGPETTLWVINATLTQYKLESDSDYHLVIQDAAGNTMITEIPSPTCVGAGSPFLPGITNARSEFNARFTPTTSFQTANIPVKVTGVGMFDFLHGQTGVAPNGIELHAVLDIIFNPGTGPDFTVSAAPTSLSLTQGGTASDTVSTSGSGGFNSAVSLSVSGLPAGVTASFTPASIAAPGTGNSTLQFTASSTATTGTFNATVTATGGGLTHTATIAVTVSAAASPNFTLSASPSSLSITQGTSGSSSISTAVSSGFNSAISLSASGLPAGVTASFAPASIAAPGSGTSTLTLTASATATTGSSTVTITATGGTVTHTVTIALTVSAAASPNFTLSASPSSLSITQGTSGSSSISTSVSGGFNSAISLSASGLPAGVTASFAPASIAAPGAGTSTLTLTASATATTGSSTVTITATGGTVTHTATIALTITASGGGTTTTQILGNPGFENGSTSPAPWVTSSGVISNSASEPPHGGTWDAWLDGFGSAHTDTVMQQVSIAANATGATLTFWLHVDTAETTTTTAFDTLTLQVRNSSGTVLSTLATFSNLNHATGYQQKTFDLTSFKGQTIQINFIGTEDSTLQTSFVLDDFALNVTTSTTTTTELIGNPGFENGAASPAPWVLTSTHTPLSIINNSASEPPHTGTFDAWMLGWGVTTTDTVMQQVAIPANATSATFSFWLHVDTGETSTTTAFDTLQVQIRNSSGTVLQTLATFSNLDHITGYQQHTFNLASFVGQTIQVMFVGQEDATLKTSFVLDDISLKVTQ